MQGFIVKILSQFLIFLVLRFCVLVSVARWACKIVKKNGTRAGRHSTVGRAPKLIIFLGPKCKGWHFASYAGSHNMFDDNAIQFMITLTTQHNT
jgi:hypothetical protein